MSQYLTSRSPNNFGPINEIVLFGGETLVRKLCLWATSDSFPIKVISSPRHVDEVANNETLSDFLIRENIEHLVVEDISDTSTKVFLGDTSRSFLLSINAAWIFASELISSYFCNRLFNLHGTRLPQNRGGGGFSWQILTGNKFGFCALHLIDEGIDTGDIVAFDEFLYPRHVENL